MLIARKYLNQLNEIALFNNVKDEEFPSMLGCIGAFVKEYDKDEIIDLTNNNLKLVGVVLSGSVHMIQEDMWGNKAILLDISENELFGETFACGGDNADNVSFVANEKIEVMLLPFARIMNTCASACSYHQKVIMNMVVLIAQKNAKLMAKIDVISKNTLREKISSYLTKQLEIQHHNRDGLNKKEFPIEIEIPLGRQQLAEYLHADRSAVFRELNNMKVEGLIDFEKKHFYILKELI